jgi:GH25 family lysozyme M1 (1,4-beta-N-acetylmuramidase)
MRGIRRSSFPLLVAIALAVGAGVIVPGPPVEAGTATDHIANCGVRLRASGSTTATTIATVSTGTGVTTTGTVSGSSWSATCVTSVSGSSWYRISAVNGQSVSSLYGVSVVYAATGMFRSAGADLEGVDVSTWQGTVDYGQVKAAGKSFVIGKATEGIGYLDPRYATNRSASRSAGLAFTAYHYARPDLNPTNPAGEADWFVDNLGLTPGMLVPALDIEVAGTLGTAGLQNWIGAWLGRVYARTGVRAMIYTNPSFWKSALGDTTLFAGQGYTVLWVAHWFVSAPTVPAANWGGRGWTFWQYDDCGTVPGIGGCVDLDRYNGTDLTTVTYGATFALTSTPASGSVRQGSSTTFTIGIARTFFTLPVGLTVSGLPAGATATLGPTPTSGSSATLTVTTSKTGTITPVGSYRLTVSGTGNGLTRTIAPTLTVTDGIAPTASQPSERLLAGTTLGSTTTPVRSSWSASDPSGIGAYLLERRVNGGSWTVVSLPSATATSIVQSLTFGATDRYTVKATDRAGNTGGWAYGPTFTPVLLQESVSAISYGGTWTSATDPSASGGSLKFATANGAWTSYAFNGSNVSWVAYRGPNRGSAAVYVDGVYKATVNLYASSYAARAVVFAANWTWNGTHTLKIVCLGTAGHPRVDIDAFVILKQL